MMPFYALQVYCEQIFYAFVKKLDKSFWTTLQEKIFAPVEYDRTLGE